MFDEEKKTEEEPVTELPVEEEPEEEPVTEETIEEAHHQKEELGDVNDIEPVSIPREKPWWKFW